MMRGVAAVLTPEPISMPTGTAVPWSDVVEPAQSRIMARALKRAGRAHELVEYPGAGHSDWDDETWRKYMTTAIGFVKAGFDGAA